jgi:hypothetical protein
VATWRLRIETLHIDMTPPGLGGLLLCGQLVGPGRLASPPSAEERAPHHLRLSLSLQQHIPASGKGIPIPHRSAKTAII